MRCCSLAGSRIWLDLTHWYFSVYSDPYENVTDMLCRVLPRWKDMISKLRLYNGIDHQGSLPKSSMASLWALSCELLAARTLQNKVLQGIAAPWVELWSASGCEVIEVHGCDGRSHTVVLSEGGSIEVATFLTIILLPECHAQVKKVMKKFSGRSLPEFAFALARSSGLVKRHEDVMLKAAQSLSKAALDVLEECFLNGALECSSSLPAGAQENYSYRCGRSQTRTDPRAKATG